MVETHQTSFILCGTSSFCQSRSTNRCQRHHIVSRSACGRVQVPRVRLWAEQRDLPAGAGPGRAPASGAARAKGSEPPPENEPQPVQRGKARPFENLERTADRAFSTNVSAHNDSDQVTDSTSSELPRRNSGRSGKHSKRNRACRPTLMSSNSSLFHLFVSL